VKPTLRRIKSREKAIANADRRATMRQEQIERAVLAGSPRDELPYLTGPRDEALRDAAELRDRFARGDFVPDPHGHATQSYGRAMRHLATGRRRSRRGPRRALACRAVRSSRSRQTAARSSSSSDDPGEPEPARGWRDDLTHGGDR
jgi:hypothetical protein